MRIEMERVGIGLGHNLTLRDISLQWEGPGLFLVTGSPGAGKSLLLRLLAGTAGSYEGSIERGFLGCGYLPQLFSFYPNLTPVEFFDYLLLLDGVTARRERARTIQALIARADMDHQARQRIGSLPLSARQRIAIMQTMIGTPQCLIWDEPEKNLRSSGQEWLLTLLDKERKQRLLVISSDNVELYGGMAIRIAVLHDGVLLFEGTQDQLLSTTQGQVWEGKIPFKQWQKFRLENIVTQAEIVDGGILVRTLGARNQEFPEFALATGTAQDAVELLIQAASLHRIGSREGNLNITRKTGSKSVNKGKGWRG